MMGCVDMVRRCISCMVLQLNLNLQIPDHRSALDRAMVRLRET